MRNSGNKQKNVVPEDFFPHLKSSELDVSNSVIIFFKMIIRNRVTFNLVIIIIINECLCNSNKLLSSILADYNGT